MVVKRVNILFIGGQIDGEILEDAPVNRLLPQLTVRTQDGIFFAENPSGGMTVMEGNLNNLWHSYSISIYKKSDLKREAEDNVEYEFVEYRDVERCSALTKKGTQCMHAAIYGKSICTTHNHMNKS